MKKIFFQIFITKNIAVIHTDERVMPKNKKVWSSWNSLLDKNDIKKNSITYWLNLLQNLNIEKNIFITLNPFFEIEKNKNNQNSKLYPPIL